MLGRYNQSFDAAKQPRYLIDVPIRLETSKVNQLFISTSLVNRFISERIVFKGATSPTFFYTSLNQIKPEMLKDAGNNAYLTALELAQNTKSKIGKIKDASQGAFSIRLRNDNSEYSDGYGKSSPYLKVRGVTNVTYFIVD